MFISKTCSLVEAGRSLMDREQNEQRSESGQLVSHEEMRDPLLGGEGEARLAGCLVGWFML